MKYVGARYIPKFEGTYDATQSYENMIVVDNGMGTSYISQKPVPAGTPLTDTEYWALYGASSGAIVNLQNQIDVITAGFVTPEMFGAVGDGLTDDSTAFQDAVNAGFVVVAKANYLINHVNITKPVYITGGGTIELENANGAGPNELAFNITADCYIDDLIFHGIVYEGNVVPNTRESTIKATNCDVISITNCKFDGCGFHYSDNGGALWTRNVAVLRANDVKKVVFTDNTITGCRNEFLQVCPTDTATSALNPSVEFSRNRIIDNIYGHSINLFAFDVQIHDNYYYNYQYGGSVYNIMAEKCDVSGDYFDSCTCDSVYDGSEGLLFHITDLNISNVHYKGACRVFCLTSSNKININHCNIQCSGLIMNDWGTKSDSIVPGILMNTSLKLHSNCIIKDNYIDINSNANVMIIREGVGYQGTSDNPITDYGQMDAVIIKDNVFNYSIAFERLSNKYILGTHSMFRLVDISGNTAINPCPNVSASIIEWAYFFESGANPALANDTVTANNNTICDVDASITIYQPVMSNATRQIIDNFNSYLNNVPSGITVANAINATQCPNMRTDL